MVGRCQPLGGEEEEGGGTIFEGKGKKNDPYTLGDNKEKS